MKKSILKTDKDFKDEDNCLEGFVESVEIYFPWARNHTHTCCEIKLEGSKKEYSLSHVDSIQKGDYVVFKLNSMFGEVLNEIIFMKKYDPISKEVLVTYKLYKPGPHSDGSPYDLSRKF